MSQADELTTQDALSGAHTDEQSVAGYLRNYFQRVRSGDLGLLPIILGLIVIALIFQSLNQNYLTPRNFVNLIVQMAGITTIAIGVVFVLLLYTPVRLCLRSMCSLKSREPFASDSGSGVAIG